MSKKQVKRKAAKLASAAVLRQVIVTNTPAPKPASRLRRQQKGQVQRPLVEDSSFKLADSEGVKEEWSNRLLLPSIGCPARPATSAVSFKPSGRPFRVS